MTLVTLKDQPFISYLSGSLQTVNKMELSKLEALAPKSKVLVVDDFLCNGGTVFGLPPCWKNLSQLAGVCVL